MKVSRAAAVVCVVFVFSVISASFADEKADRANMQIFMRKKLEYARNINEGIVLERFDLISFNAAGMRKMTQTNFWIQTNNTNYLAKVTAFQNNLDQLFYAGGDRDLNRATAAYGEVLKSCVDCHHFVRKEQVGLPRWGSKEQ